MESVKYNGNYKDNMGGTTNPSIPTNGQNQQIDMYSIQSAFQAMIISKLMECHEHLVQFFNIENPLLKMIIAFILLHPYQAFTIIKKIFTQLMSYMGYVKRTLVAFAHFKPQPKQKTFEINYLNDNSINHLYSAFDWYLKSNSKTKKNENHMLLMLNKPIDGTKVTKEYKVQQTVPEEKETEFTYNKYTFSYSKTSFDDSIYTPTGEVKKKNYKLLIWTYDCDKEIFSNLTQHVANLYAKSKVDDVWVQKIYNNENMNWSENVLERNKRKFSTVVMKNNKNLEMERILKHFNDSEEWHLERGIPYKKSFLFYGPPGTGKSSMIKAIANELQRHIHFVNLANVQNDQELTSLMSKICYKETVVVIEDIDAQGKVAHKRSLKEEQKKQEEENDKDDENNNKKNKGVDTKQEVTLSCLLNQLDGINNNHGMILVMTTNYPKILDEALVRDGRVDERLLFDFVDHQQIYTMFVNFYNGDNNVTLNMIKKEIDVTKYNIAPCNIENSMRRYYENSNDALNDIITSTTNKKTFEDFEIN